MHCIRNGVLFTQNLVMVDLSERDHDYLLTT